jgi:hypothetical protein
MLDFADREFQWDSKLKQFRVTKGAGKGGFISREAILSLTRAAVKANQAQLLTLADDLATNTITLREFETHAAKHIRLIHTQQAEVAAGGYDKVTPEMWLEVSNELKRQYKDGRNLITGERFGLKWLCRDIIDGKVTLPRLKQRLALYANSGKVSFWHTDLQVQFDKGLTYGIRVLGATDKHCTPCVYYASLPPQPLTSIIRPTQQCVCGTNCLCTVVAMTVEEAISRTGSQGLLR